MKYLLLILIFLFSLYAQEEYTLGEGYQVGELPMYVGGYFSLDYRKKDEQSRYRLDDIALLSYGGNDTISYLVELEFKEYYVHYNEDNISWSTTDRRLYLERLYFDYVFNDETQIRLGKFNSPIGLWNLVPINVLRETTSNPISTEIIFPQYTTGVNLNYTRFDEGEFRLDLILQNNTPLDDEYNNYDIDKHYALGLNYEINDFTYIFNTGYFAKREDYIGPHDFAYAQLSLGYESEQFELLSEFGLQQSNEGDMNLAAYVQGVYRFTPEHIGILRLESYKDELTGLNDSFAVVGYTYRPLYPIALKSEYQQHNRNSENKFIFSFSVLF